MSTGQNCTIFERVPGEWWLLLETFDSLADREDGQGRDPDDAACGPYPSKDAATDHLRARHANPGGWSVEPYRPGHETLWHAEIAQARERHRRTGPC